MQAHGVRIETIDTIEGCREHCHLQMRVWGRDAQAAVPVSLLIALTRHGGVVLGAYAGDTMVGLLLGMPALDEGRLTHVSQMLGVHPQWRGRGIGERLKWRQRELVLAQGIDTVTWTFDPLEAVNARLNLAHLGGVVSSYVRDYYGPMDDQINRGLPSDRFIVTWHLDAPRVRERAPERDPERNVPGVPGGEDPAATTSAEHATGVPRGDGATDGRAAGVVLAATDGREAGVALAAEEGPEGLRLPGHVVLPGGAAVLVEIPLRVQEIKRQSLEAALAWRLAVRDACERLFAAGYIATDVVRRGERVFYLMEKFV